MSRNLMVLVLLLISSLLMGQEPSFDLGSWTSARLIYKAGDKITLKARPIVRHNQDLSNYDNTSIDLSVSYKIDKNWSVQLLDRHWFIPDGPDRQFYFIDVNHKANLSEKFTLSNTLRYHLAVNWNRLDPNFIRYQPILSYKPGGKFIPFVGYTAFYRIEDFQGFVGARLKAGCKYAASSKIGLQLTYWNQDEYNKEFPINKAHVILFNLNYNLN